MKRGIKRSPQLPLTHALAWIVGSTFLITGSAHYVLTKEVGFSRRLEKTPVDIITSMIQTGPQKDALRSEYLAELIGLSTDRPIKASALDVSSAEKALLASPLIADAHVRIIKPSTVYIDYTLRQPIAWLYDAENTGVDKDGFPLPMYPFFPPKRLPEIYLGLGNIGENDSDTITWNRPLEGRRKEIAFDILKRLSPFTKEQFRIKRIDSSKIDEESLGRRELTVAIENELYVQGREEPISSLHWLRLSVNNYPKELGNYLELRKNLLEKEFTRSRNDFSPQAIEKVIDLRLTDLAYVSEGPL